MFVGGSGIPLVYQSDEDYDGEGHSHCWEFSNGCTLSAGANDRRCYTSWLPNNKGDYRIPK